MKVLRELIGLFVDDGSLASGIVVLIALAWLLPPLLGLGPVASALAFLAGCLALLFENVLRGARR